LSHRLKHNHAGGVRLWNWSFKTQRWKPLKSAGEAVAEAAAEAMAEVTAEAMAGVMAEAAAEAMAGVMTEAAAGATAEVMAEAAAEVMAEVMADTAEAAAGQAVPDPEDPAAGGAEDQAAASAEDNAVCCFAISETTTRIAWLRALFPDQAIFCFLAAYWAAHLLQNRRLPFPLLSAGHTLKHIH
jgi:hypothetical protein